MSLHVKESENLQVQINASRSSERNLLLLTSYENTFSLVTDYLFALSNFFNSTSFKDKMPILPVALQESSLGEVLSSFARNVESFCDDKSKILQHLKNHEILSCKQNEEISKLVLQNVYFCIVDVYMLEKISRHDGNHGCRKFKTWLRVSK